METEIGRRSFLVASTALGLGAASKAGVVGGSSFFQPEEASSPYFRLPQEKVKAVVGAAHTDLAKVKELVGQCPQLALATWDWGFGDCETALGAASHVGRRDIAQFLMEHGARPDIFTFAMLGNLDAVKAMVQGQPNVQKIAGPHGISLLRHAIMGGPQAAEVRTYLELLGDAGLEPKANSLTEELMARYTGTYRLEHHPDVKFTIRGQKGGLVFEWGNEPFRALTSHGANEFSPAGAVEVRLLFEMDANQAVSVSSRNYEPAFKAFRAD